MSIERKLVSIRRITGKVRISKSRYEQIFVDGWSVVARLEEGYQVGDLVVYFEIDSFIPSTDSRLWELESAFTEYNGGRGYHVHSFMTQGRISQGLMFKIGRFPDIKEELDRLTKLHGEEEGTNRAMELSFEKSLGVVKWELPSDLQGQILGPPPSFFPLPGYDRVQNCPNFFHPDNMDTLYTVTEKLDGLSMIVYHVVKTSPFYRSLPSCPDADTSTGGRLGICNQDTDVLDTPDDIGWSTARQQDLLDKLPLLLGPERPNVAIMGELCGHSIHGNGLGFAEGENRFYAFGIYDIVAQRSVPLHVVERICRQFDIPHVPVLGRQVRLGDLAGDVEELLRKAEGKGFRWQNREGFVMTPVKRGGDVVKVISNEWLIQRGL